MELLQSGEGRKRAIGVLGVMGPPGEAVLGIEVGAALEHKAAPERQTKKDSSAPCGHQGSFVMSRIYLGVGCRLLQVGLLGLCVLGAPTVGFGQQTGTIKSSFGSLGGVSPSMPRPFATRSIMDVQREQAQAPAVGPSVGITGIVGTRTRYLVGDRYCDTRSFYDSGFRLDGEYVDDNLRVRLHLGSDLHRLRRSNCPSYWRTTSGVYFTGYGYSTYGWPYSYRPPVVGQPPIPYATTPTAQTAAQPEPVTAIESARWSMMIGAYEDAAKAYREHLVDEPDDALAVRELGMVLMETKRVTEGVAVIALAYDMDPSLAAKAIEEVMFPGGARDLRHAVTRAVTFGHKTKSGAAWLTVAMLMQGQGRNDRALEMLERAELVGLNPDIVEAMKRELRL